jgi:hypothetical protein
MLELADYRRRVQALYAAVRDEAAPVEERWQHWVATRDELFARHSQTTLSPEQVTTFEGLRYYDYDPAYRLLVEMEPIRDSEIITIPLQNDGEFQMRRVGRLAFEVGGQSAELTLYWILGYGGGLFLPFRDASGQGGATYPGTRYLLDTIKGADLGQQDGRLVLDFNFAYNPSCAYHHRWHCPLAPQENWLDIPIPVGEQAYPDAK